MYTSYVSLYTSTGKYCMWEDVCVLLCMQINIITTENYFGFICIHNTDDDETANVKIPSIKIALPFLRYTTGVGNIVFCSEKSSNKFLGGKRKLAKVGSNNSATRIMIYEFS